MLRLRRSRRIFSHAIVHDAIFIEKTVTAGEVRKAFSEAASETGVRGVSISAKDWSPARGKFMEFLRRMTPPYDPAARIHWEEKPDNRTINADPAQRPIWQLIGKLPKDAYEQ